MDLDVKDEWWPESGREGLDALSLHQRADVVQQSLEPVLVFSKVPVGLQAIGSPSGLAA